MSIPVETIALSDHIGVEVRGIPATSFGDPALATTLGGLLGRHHLLLFRERDLAVADQIAIMGQFGEVVDEGGNGLRHVSLSIDPSSSTRYTEGSSMSTATTVCAGNDAFGSAVMRIPLCYGRFGHQAVGRVPTMLARSVMRTSGQ